ncbi:response regulator transcription factor [Paenibacillus mucilaginosus]|uniref:Two component LuxR family transcriptional regulator n=3 Tax=Paenibacillus mucilaginosus TaxID=61624 RepID=H6NRK9_9BACL|nr:response regulator transcription factor [Paenibacillus mucilaginosus]AEI38988.1 two component transcriptional regulator, LuxR family [Paenibacillus mucilaginosus KNP414]AFC27291.1 two component LuxR family transcriptional regulator [Paenibacillus mucilaginosus 3016]MCG7216605.1 response regulator transcription factor [Paenibacillus mucilaginosus]WDM28029.1 response regulator transcription factor [Paenibacillus mucilaginosus]WFA16204.1 response regulator transcription factor [Paenibacillus m
MNSATTIVLADDQTLMRDGLHTILTLEDDLEVVGTAENGQQALELVEQLRPNLVLMDIQMPVMNGIESTKRIKKQFPETIILILTTFAEDDYIVEGLANGASGFLLKDMPGDKLIQSIRDCVKGQLMMPAVIASKLAARLSSASAAATAEFDPKRLKSEGISFTEREKNIISLMMEGKNNRQIAGLLFMSEGTVKNYVSMIYNKIGTNDRTKAILALKEWMTP